MRSKARRGALSAGVILSGAIGLLAPGGAQATSVATTGTALEVSADPGELNRITIERAGAFFRISDDGAALTTADPDCDQLGGHLARCARAGITTIEVEARDLDDFVAVQGATPATINAGAGADTVQGGSGDDLLRANAGVTFGFAGELMLGGPGGDVLRGPTNVNASATLRGEDGNDVLIGGPSSEDLNGGPGADVIRGGDGNFDRAEYFDSGSAVTVTIDDVAGDGTAGEGDNVRTDVEAVSGSPAADLIVGSAANNSLSGAGGDDVLRGGLGDDTLNGDGGEDVLNGEEGTDLLFGGFANTDSDTYIGGEGVDRAQFDDKFDPAVPLAVSINNVADDGAPGEGDNVRTTVEDVVGGPGPDTITGSPAANTLQGGSGDDELVGGDGNDRLFGDFTFAGGASLGDDALIGGPGDDLLNGSQGADDFSGAQGLDTADFSQVGNPLTVTINGVADDGTAGEGDNVRGNVEGVVGGQASDTITGSDTADNLLIGGSGDDSLRGLGGDDLFDGEIPGFFGALGSDTFNGGPGNDGVSYASHFDPITADLDNVGDDGAPGENDNIKSSVENLFGGPSSDTLTGSGAGNVLQGGLGGNFDNDILNGLGGADFLAAGNGVDTLNGDGGNDRIHSRGDGFADTDNCGAGNDRAEADSFDVLNDCEIVFNPAAAMQQGSEGGAAKLEARWRASRRMLRFAEQVAERLPSRAETRRLSPPAAD